MKTILQLKKQNLLLFSLLISSFCFGQGNSILFNEIKHHQESGDFKNRAISLFSETKEVLKDKEKFISLKINLEKLNTLTEKSDKFISVLIPFSETENKTILLKKRQLLQDDFKLVVETDKGKETREMTSFVGYSGVIESEERNSLVSIVFYNNSLSGSISIGNKTYSLKQKENGLYRLTENLSEENQIPFNCGVSDNDNPSLKSLESLQNTQTIIPKCVKLHFEITKSLNDQFGGVNQSIAQFMVLFNLVQTKFANEGITVRISYLKIWNTDDPYYQSWFGGNPGDPGAFQDLGFNSFQNLGGNINGNIGILLGTFSGGISGLAGGAPCPNQGYNANTIYPNSTNQNATTIMHEIGHCLGSHHTHWCGWTGGALDNCYTTEGGCAPGPNPVNGGTIMSYCGGYNIINNGFGTQPNAVINSTVTNESCITSCNSDITCEDNIVSVNSVTNTNATSFTINWTSDYPVKVYFKELLASSFTLLNTVPLPNNSYAVNYVPTNDCTIQKFEIKLVSVCPNGDSKPTVIVYSPQSHLKPYVGLLDNYLCNITNPTVSNLQAVGQNLKWYTTETGGTQISSLFIIPINTYLEYFVSQTANGCESERTRTIIYIQNIEMPNGPNQQVFQCEFPKATDLYNLSSQYSSPNSYLRWYLNATDQSYLANDQFNLINNSYYYAANVSVDYHCVSPRFPVYISTNPSYYSIPFIETFNSPFNCELGYVSPYYANNSGSNFGNSLVLNSVLSDINNYVGTKKINLIANAPIQITIKVKHLNSSNSTNPLKIKISSNSTSQVILGQIIPSNANTFDSYSFNYTPTVSTLYRIFFEYNCPLPNIGYIVDDFSISYQNLGTNNFTNENNIKIYPNPTHNIINISTQNQIINQIAIYDLLGRLLKVKKTNETLSTINIQDLPNAIYLIEVKTDKGIITKKIVKY